jgi:hypothetical protein
MRGLIAFLIATAIGIAAGLYLGWVAFPVETIDSGMARLAPRYIDEYTLMVAYGYVSDGDLGGAITRLRPLEVENLPAHIQTTTERFISSSRRVDDIRALVALAEGVGRLTPIMEPYRRVGGDT